MPCAWGTNSYESNEITDPIHVNDLHATILKLLGFEHTKLTFLFQGRDQRLTDEDGANELNSRRAW
jgi:hypothetical protein